MRRKKKTLLGSDAGVPWNREKLHSVFEFSGKLDPPNFKYISTLRTKELNVSWITNFPWGCSTTNTVVEYIKHTYTSIHYDIVCLMKICIIICIILFYSTCLI